MSFRSVFRRSSTDQYRWSRAGRGDVRPTPYLGKHALPSDSNLLAITDHHSHPREPRRNPHSAHGWPTSRGFLPWRHSDDGPVPVAPIVMGPSSEILI